MEQCVVSGDDNTACSGAAQQSLRRASAINCPNNKLGGKVKEGIFSGLVTDKTLPRKPERERGEEPTEEEDEWKE